VNRLDLSVNRLDLSVNRLDLSVDLLDLGGLHLESARPCLGFDRDGLLFPKLQIESRRNDLELGRYSLVPSEFKIEFTRFKTVAGRFKISEGVSRPTIVRAGEGDRLGGKARLHYKSAITLQTHCRKNNSASRIRTSASTIPHPFRSAQ
jgi:hypothetical protein